MLFAHFNMSIHFYYYFLKLLRNHVSETKHVTCVATIEIKQAIPPTLIITGHIEVKKYKEAYTLPLHQGIPTLVLIAPGCSQSC